MAKLQDLLTEKGFNETDFGNISECINKSGEWIPKARFDEVNTEKNSLKEQNQSFSEKLKEFQKSVGDNDELKKAIEKYKSDIKEINEKHEAEMKKFIRDNAIKAKFADKVHDADFVLSKLNQEEIIYDEKTKNIIGLDNQLEKLKENMSWVFKEEQGLAGGGYKPQQGINPNSNPKPNEEVSTAKLFAKAMNKKQ